jgi:hypothetical protein
MLRRTNVFLISSGAIRRKNVWEVYNGSVYDALCYCCENTKITPFNFECAHVVADAKGGSKKIENLRPCCFHCNRAMGTQNFFVYKSLLHGNIHIDTEKYSENQRSITQFYSQIQKNMRSKYYASYFDEWVTLMEKSIDYRQLKMGDEIINRFRCNCKFSFDYVVTKNDFELTCRSSKQNIIDVICDHTYCLIDKKSFIDGTLESKSYKKWLTEKKFTEIQNMK